MSTLGETAVAQSAIHPDTTIGTVRLTVTDLARSRDFYERAIGLRTVELKDGTLACRALDGSTLVELHGDSSAAPTDRGATGLYHFAILVPSRRDLAFALARVTEARWPLDGASDHLVSEALYLSDPDGNGIEIYRDRLREEWPRSNGELAMSTLPLGLDSLLGELASEIELQRQAPSGTRIGHVHLQVADLREAEAFYNGVLGFDVMVRAYPGALFVSAGGYHHHIGLNTWNSRSAGPPKPGSLGLRSFEVVLPDQRELERVLERVRTSGIPLEQDGPGSLIRDPSGNGVMLRAA